MKDYAQVMPMPLSTQLYHQVGFAIFSNSSPRFLATTTLNRLTSRWKIGTATPVTSVVTLPVRRIHTHANAATIGIAMSASHSVESATNVFAVSAWTHALFAMTRSANTA